MLHYFQNAFSHLFLFHVFAVIRCTNFNTFDKLTEYHFLLNLDSRIPSFISKSYGPLILFRSNKKELLHLSSVFEKVFK